MTASAADDAAFVAGFRAARLYFGVTTDDPDDHDVHGAECDKVRDQAYPCTCAEEKTIRDGLHDVGRRPSLATAPGPDTYALEARHRAVTVTAWLIPDGWRMTVRRGDVLTRWADNGPESAYRMAEAVCDVMTTELTMTDAEAIADAQRQELPVPDDTDRPGPATLARWPVAPGTSVHGIDAEARAAQWRQHVPDITAAELAVLDPLLGAEPNALRRLVAAHRAGAPSATPAAEAPGTVTGPHRTGEMAATTLAGIAEDVERGKPLGPMSAAVLRLIAADVAAWHAAGAWPTTPGAVLQLPEPPVGTVIAYTDVRAGRMAVRNVDITRDATITGPISGWVFDSPDDDDPDDSRDDEGREVDDQDIRLARVVGDDVVLPWAIVRNAVLGGDDITIIRWGDGPVAAATATVRPGSDRVVVADPDGIALHDGPIPDGDGHEAERAQALLTGLGWTVDRWQADLGRMVATVHHNGGQG